MAISLRSTVLDDAGPVMNILEMLYHHEDEIGHAGE